MNVNDDDPRVGVVPARAEPATSVASAVDLATRLVEAELAPVEIASLQYELGVPLVDVGFRVATFNAQEHILKSFGLGAPLVRPAGSPALPICLLPDASGRETGRDDLARSRRVVARLLNASEQRLEDGDHEEVRLSLHQRLVAFLAARLAPAVSTSHDPLGMPFRVETELPGFRIHYSPAYFFDFRATFGSQWSTPVYGFIEPGIYVFGAQDGSMPTPKFDLVAEYEVPPSSAALLLV